MKKITITVSDEFHAKFIEAAKKSGMRRDAFGRSALEEKLEKIENECKK